MRRITRKEETADVNTYQVDDTKEPKAIDMTVTVLAADDAKTKFGWTKVKMEGIYSIEGDKLRLCLVYANKEKRPSEFSSKHILIDLQRVKP